MSQVFDCFEASMNVISFERNRAKPDFVWYMCGSGGCWQWKDSLTGKSSGHSFVSREDAVIDAKAALGRC